MLGLKNELKIMRVVLDTNVLISAFLWQKNLKPIYQAIRQKKIVPCFNQATWQELKRVLAYKKFAKQLAKTNIAEEEIAKLLTSRAHFSISHSEINIIQDDPSDNNQLACAESAQASFIVSGDKHLLRIKKFEETPIVSPKEFLGILTFFDNLNAEK